MTGPLRLSRRAFGGLGAALAIAASGTRSGAGSELQVQAEVRALYLHFLKAQNARDLAEVRRTLWDAPDFLWVSDGRRFWGPDALVERMASFQRAEVWRVEPDLAEARVVEVSGEAAYLSLPLVLVIGSAAEPTRLRWLVGVLCRRGVEGWRIAALFTTEDKTA